MTEKERRDLHDKGIFTVTNSLTLSARVPSGATGFDTRSVML